jgi:hypothetical protein
VAYIPAEPHSTTKKLHHLTTEEETSCLKCILRESREWDGQGVQHTQRRGMPEGKKPLGRPRHKWKDSTRCDLKERWTRVIWVGLIWLRLLTSGGPSWTVGEFLISWPTGGFSRTRLHGVTLLSGQRTGEQPALDWGASMMNDSLVDDFYDWLNNERVNNLLRSHSAYT